MQQPAECAPSSSSSSFAGLLAALAEPAAAKPDARWDDSGLAEDVATLSYERALKAHGRYKATDPGDAWSSAEGIEPESTDRAGNGASRERAARPEQDAGGQRGETAGSKRELKLASITIRLSQAECAQLKARAVEAGLTISAYMRSCTFEAEALRAQVKEALAELRAGGRDAQPAEESKDAPRRWWARILPHGR